MAINPLNFFDVGAQIGAVNSPAAGPAQSIRSILAQAQKKGLLETQSQAQGQQAMDLAQFKAGLEPDTKPFQVLNPDGTLSDPVEVPAKGVIKARPRTGIEDLFADDVQTQAQGGGSSPEVQVVFDNIMKEIQARRQGGATAK